MPTTERWRRAGGRLLIHTLSRFRQRRGTHSWAPPALLREPPVLLAGDRSGPRAEADVAAQTGPSLPGRAGARPPGADDCDRGAYHERLRSETRASALIGGVVLLVAFPLWSAFDWLVLPARAGQFMIVRVAFEVLIGLALAAMWHPAVGGKYPQQTAFLLFALPQLSIAWMVPRSAPELTAYLLGFSLVIFGCPLIMVWHWQLTMWMTALSLAATAVFVGTDPSGPSKAGVATIAFYLGTAGLIAVVGQYHRYRAGWEQFRTEAALEGEQRRNELLVDELRRLSQEDPLTGVSNRRAWEAWVEREWSLARRTGRKLSVILCDFDRFKDVNDTAGHAVGDAVLRAGADRLRATARSSDLVARLGGDEFVIGCPDTDGASAGELAHRLAAAARELAWPHQVHMTLTFGVAELNPDGETITSLLGRADNALYLAKATRGSVVQAT